MVSSDHVIEKLRNSIQLDDVFVQSGENSYVQIIAVSDQFIGMNRVKRQQIIYKPLTEYIANKSIHAVSIQAYTMEEWRLKKKLVSF